MGNNRIERNSKIFHEELNKCILPEVAELPNSKCKRHMVENIEDFVVCHHKQLPILYRYSPADFFNISALLEDNIYLVSARYMNDEHEGQVWHAILDPEENETYKQLIQTQVYLKSFSEDKNSIYMWKNYADNFSGICVAYDFSSASEELLRKLYPVQYSPIAFRCSDHKIAISTPYLFMRKSMRWEEEHEWRFIETGAVSKPKPVNIKKYIRAIYFGIGMDDSLKNHIEHQMRLNRRSIQLYDMKMTITAKKRDEKDYGDPNF